MLGAGNHTLILSATDRLSSEDTCKVRIITKSLPIATALRDTAQWTDNCRRESHGDPFAVELATDAVSALVREIAVPAAQWYMLLDDHCVYESEDCAHLAPA